jgi:hypothetical protein
VKTADLLGKLFPCVFFFGLILLVLIFGFLIRKNTRRKFHQKCRALGLNPSPLNADYCLGNWKDGNVAVRLCRIDKHLEMDFFMELGVLPEIVVSNIGHHLESLQANYLRLGTFGQNGKFDRIVSGIWRGHYFQARLNFDPTDLQMRQMFDTVYFVRKELQRRVYGK